MEFFDVVKALNQTPYAKFQPVPSIFLFFRDHPIRNSASNNFSVVIYLQSQNLRLYRKNVEIINNAEHKPLLSAQVSTESTQLGSVFPKHPLNVQTLTKS